MFIAIIVLAGIIWTAQLLPKNDGKLFIDLLRMIQTPHLQESHYVFKYYIFLHNQNAKQVNESESH